MNHIPEWVKSVPPQQPCLRHALAPTASQHHSVPYTIQFATGKTAPTYVPLREYAEYLDSLGIRTTLEYHRPQQRYRLVWGNFETRSAAETVQACLRQQFQLIPNVVEHDIPVSERGVSLIGETPLESFGRVISPDKHQNSVY